MSAEACCPGTASSAKRGLSFAPLPQPSVFLHEAVSKGGPPGAHISARGWCGCAAWALSRWASGSAQSYSAGPAWVRNGGTPSPVLPLGVSWLSTLSPALAREAMLTVLASPDPRFSVYGMPGLHRSPPGVAGEGLNRGTLFPGP